LIQSPFVFLPKTYFLLTPLEILQKNWGYQNFKDPQQAIIESVLEDKDTLAILPTGGGKSICYQVPALLKSGIALVISPLIALMQDQVYQLKNREIGAELITSQLSSEEIAVVLAKASLGSVKLLYIAPERLQSRAFILSLQNLPISLIAVDEAHCIAQWGHDFRPAYLKINLIKTLFPNAPILALTATATPKIQEEILMNLEMKNPQVFKQTLKRENLVYKVMHSQNELDDLVYFLSKNPGPGIVFTRTRKQTFEVATYLQEQGLNAEYFHAKLPIEEKKAKQDIWTKSNNQIMVSTNAFGMGIDKANVRTVIHLDLPTSLEAYVQEAGRAGRDLQDSEAVLFLKPSAQEEIEKIFKSGLPTKQEFEWTERLFYNYFEIGENERPEEKREFNFHDFVTKFDLNKNTTQKILDFLERKDVISIQPFSSYSRAQVFVNPNLMEFRNNLHYNVIEFLVRKHPGIQSMEKNIHEFSIARELNKPVKKIKRILHKLKDAGYIQYQSQEVQWISFNRPRESDYIKNTLWREFEALQIAQWKKLQDMIYYASQKEYCREKLILRYFGENPKQPCGKCDVCLTKIEKAPPERILEFLEDSPKTIQEVLLHFLNLPKESILETMEYLMQEGFIEKTGIDSFIKRKR
jgi:ATP-dependent DNA helicase RecQ